jgi:hypothetical protein
MEIFYNFEIIKLIIIVIIIVISILLHELSWCPKKPLFFKKKKTQLSPLTLFPSPPLPSPPLLKQAIPYSRISQKRNPNSLSTFSLHNACLFHLRIFSKSIHKWRRKRRRRRRAL